jgi:hypothetical protein
MRRTWLVAPAVGLILLLAPPALAKGAGLELDEQIQRNEVLSADAVLYAKSKAAAKAYGTGGPYFAYLSPLLPGRHVLQAPPLPTGARRLGTIEVGGYSKVFGTERWTVRVGVDFKVPAVSPGNYRIDVCTDPCTRTIEELYPTVTRVVSGPLEERLEERLDHVEHYQHGAMDTAAARVERRAQKNLNGLREYTRQRLDRLSERIDEVTVAPQRVRRAAPDKPFPTGVAAVAFATGALTASAGWFFGSRLAVSASHGQKKVSALKEAV